MKELINIKIQNDQQLTSARELQKVLGARKKYYEWISQARADTGKKTGIKAIKNNGRPVDNQWTSNGPHRLGKDRLGKDSINNIVDSSESPTPGGVSPSFKNACKIADALGVSLDELRGDKKCNH